MFFFYVFVFFHVFGNNKTFFLPRTHTYKYTSVCARVCVCAFIYLFIIYLFIYLFICLFLFIYLFFVYFFFCRAETSGKSVKNLSFTVRVTIFNWLKRWLFFILKSSLPWNDRLAILALLSSSKPPHSLFKVIRHLKKRQTQVFFFFFIPSHTF